MNRILAALLALVATQAFSQSYPNKPVRVIVPFATGSASDLIGRTVADRLTQALGQPFLVENRPGAGGTIGTEVVAKAPPDGYTLLVTTAATPITATAVRGLKYETAAFASITVLTHSPLGFAAHPQFAPKTVRQFIDYAKANPGKVNFGSLGIATSHHVTGEKLKLDAGIDMVHVPYKGSGAAHADLTHQLLAQILPAGAAGYNHGSSNRQQQRRHLRDQTVADRQGNIGARGGIESQAMLGHADDQTTEDIDGQNQKTGDGIALHEFGGTVHGAIEICFLPDFGAALARLIGGQQARIQIGIDRHLLAGHRVQGKAGCHFRNSSGTLGDHHQIDDNQNSEHKHADNEVAADHEFTEGLNNLAR